MNDSQTGEKATALPSSYRRTIMALGALFAVGLMSAVAHLSHLTSNLVESTILLNATRYSETLADLRTLYTSEVIARVEQHGIKVSDNYTAHAAAIPLPATLSMALGERMSERSEGMQVRLYSPYPFPEREATGGLKDAFGEEAWAFFQQHPERSFYRYDEVDGQRMLRYATADLLAPECVHCHNTHPDTPKSDWRAGDVRGILEVCLPVGRIEARTDALFRNTFLVIGGASLLGLMGLGLVIARFRRVSDDLEAQVQGRTAELARINGQLQREIAERERAEAALQRSRDQLEQRVRERTAALQEKMVESEQIAGELRASEERFRNFSEATFEGIAITVEGVVREANSQFAAMFGYDPDEMTGMNASDLAVPEFRERVRRHIAAGSEMLYESRGLRKDGSTFPIEVRGRTVRREDGPARVTAIRDISGRRQLEDQLRQAQKMEAVGQLTAGVAHNFNNKLQGILMNLELAMFGSGYDTSLDAAKTSVLQATEIVRQLMVFSRADRGATMQAADLVEILDGAVEIARGTFDAGIELGCAFPADLPPVSGDAVQLEQVFLNFLINARDAVGGMEAPQIRVAAQAVSRADVELPATLIPGPADYIRVDVVDNGIGMDAATQQRIFEPFFTTKDTGTGTGLGLATAYGIIDNHGGWIRCESRPGAGASFAVYLPVAEAPVAAIASPKAPVEALTGTETILLVEDDETLLGTLTSMLGNRGYEVLAAEDGLAGWALFEGARERVDIALLDLSMPKLSGEKLLQRMRALDPEIRVIVSTGNMEVGIDPSQMQGLLRKPYSMNLLLAEVRRVLDGG